MSGQRITGIDIIPVRNCRQKQIEIETDKNWIFKKRQN